LARICIALTSPTPPQKEHERQGPELVLSLAKLGEVFCETEAFSQQTACEL